MKHQTQTQTNTSHPKLLAEAFRLSRLGQRRRSWLFPVHGLDQTQDAVSGRVHRSDIGTRGRGGVGRCVIDLGGLTFRLW